MLPTRRRKKSEAMLVKGFVISYYKEKHHLPCHFSWGELCHGPPGLWQCGSSSVQNLNLECPIVVGSLHHELSNKAYSLVVLMRVSTQFVWVGFSLSSFQCNVSFLKKKLRTAVPSIGTWFGGHLIFKRRCVESKWQVIIYLTRPFFRRTGNFNLSNVHIPLLLFVFTGLDWLYFWKVHRQVAHESEGECPLEVSCSFWSLWIVMLMVSILWS